METNSKSELRVDSKSVENIGYKLEKSKKKKKFSSIINSKTIINIIFIILLVVLLANIIIFLIKFINEKRTKKIEIINYEKINCDPGYYLPYDDKFNCKKCSVDNCQKCFGNNDNDVCISCKPSYFPIFDINIL